VAVFTVGFIFTAILLTRGLIVLFPVTPGKIPLDKIPTSWILLVFLDQFHNFFLVNTDLLPFELRPLFYRCLGTKMGRNVRIGGFIADPSLVTLGDNANLGGRCALTCHVVEGKSVSLGTIKIGKNALVGAAAMIGPFVEIGEGAVIGGGSLVTKGTIIPPGEIWAGNPARCLRKRET